jgi:hypothetical protein
VRRWQPVQIKATLFEALWKAIASFILSLIECMLGKFGQGCEENCPLNCYDNECDYINGNCVEGCKPGFQGNKCKESKLVAVIFSCQPAALISMPN